MATPPPPPPTTTTTCRGTEVFVLDDLVSEAGNLDGDQADLRNKHPQNGDTFTNNGSEETEMNTGNGIITRNRISVLVIVIVITAFIIIIPMAVHFNKAPDNDCASYENSNPFPDQCGMRDSNINLDVIEGEIENSIFVPASIVGGRSVKPGQYPWQVDLEKCGGTVIDSKHVVTAAQCVCKRNSEEIERSIEGNTIYVGNNIAARKNKSECTKAARKITRTTAGALGAVQRGRSAKGKWLWKTTLQY
jgi:hypothetical protein